MTSEIVIMNKEAIAIAADSAVTIRKGILKKEKIFTSTNKIFTLSKYRPVGIMIYGRADFMGIPWETIIKIYRKKLGTKGFSSLKEYAENLIDFLNKENKLFPETQQKKYFHGNIYGYFYIKVKREIDKQVNDILTEQGEITIEEIKDLVLNFINNQYNLWKEAEFLPSNTEKDAQQLVKKYKPLIEETINEIFEALPLSETLIGQLIEIAVNMFLKHPIIPFGAFSGVVITGFGEEDYFPSIRCYSMKGIINNKMNYLEDDAFEISFENKALIYPFAEGEMVFTFMEGVDRNYQTSLENDLNKIFRELPEIVTNNIKEINDNENEEIKETLKQVFNTELKQYLEKLKIYRKENFAYPIIEVVAVLPKEELAVMAETFVNLTTFKKKISWETETVGEPIDVAIISKGDGFVWIKRKHYFQSEMNPHFFENYFGK